jgi:hypothetical protein
MCEGTRMARDTRDEGDPSGALGFETTTPPVNFDSQPRNSYSVTTGTFESRFDAHVSSPFPQPPKPAKEVVSPPTSILAYDNYRDTHTVRRKVEISTVPLVGPPPTPFAFNGLGGICVNVGVYTLGDNTMQPQSVPYRMEARFQIEIEENLGEAMAQVAGETFLKHSDNCCVRIDEIYTRFGPASTALHRSTFVISGNTLDVGQRHVHEDAYPRKLSDRRWYTLFMPELSFRPGEWVTRTVRI